MGNGGGRRHQRKEQRWMMGQREVEAAPQACFIQSEGVGVKKVTTGLRAGRAG